MTTDEMRTAIWKVVNGLVATPLKWDYDADNVAEYHLGDVSGKVVRKQLDGQRYGVIHVPWPRELGYGVVWLDWEVLDATSGLSRVLIKVYDIPPMNGGRILYRGLYRKGRVEWETGGAKNDGPGPTRQATAKTSL